MNRYCVCVAADVNGEKVNLEFFFDNYGPSTAQILSRATECFSRMFDARNINRVFAISSAVIFNDVTRTWDRLERSSQLVHNCQIYLFQPDVLDIPGEIPDPTSATEHLISYRSPYRGYDASPRAVPPEVYVPRSTANYASPVVPISRSPERVQTLLRQRNEHQGEVIPGDSILHEEREKEEKKLRLPVDDHRKVVRRETQEFPNSLSPERHH